MKSMKSLVKKSIKFICFVIFTIITVIPSIVYVALLLHPEMAEVINLMIVFRGNVFLFQYVVPNLIYFVTWTIVVYKIVRGRCKWWYCAMLMGVSAWNWWTLIRLGALLGVLDEMFVGVSQPFILLILPIADVYRRLNDAQRVTIIGVLVSVVILLYLLYRVVGKRRRHVSDTSSKTGTELRGDRRVSGDKTRRMEFYTTPGTYEIIEERLHKYEPKKHSVKKSWGKELDDWVKERRSGYLDSEPKKTDEMKWRYQEDEESPLSRDSEEGEKQISPKESKENGTPPCSECQNYNGCGLASRRDGLPYCSNFRVLKEEKRQ